MEPSTHIEANVDELNETGQRTKSTDRRQVNQPVAVERRKVQRRRLIDPTTCERDYSNDEIEFMQAMDEYKRKSGRMFPTCSEILEVLRGMGYVRVELPAEEAETEAISGEETANEGNVRTSDEIAKDLGKGDLETYGEFEDSLEEDGLDSDFDED